MKIDKFNIMNAEFTRLQKLAGLLKEDNATSRMEGLLDQKAWKEAMSKFEGIVEFYQNEGFDDDEIIEFIQGKLEESMSDMMKFM